MDSTFLDAVLRARAMLRDRTTALPLARMKEAEQAVVACLEAGQPDAVRGLCVQLFGQGSRDPKVIVQATHEFLDAGNLAQTRRFRPYIDRMDDPAGLIAVARCEYLAGQGEAARRHVARALVHPAISVADLLCAFESMIESGDAQSAVAAASAILDAPEFALVRLRAASCALAPESVECALRSDHSTPGIWLRVLYGAPLSEAAAPIAGPILDRHFDSSLCVSLAARHWFRGEFRLAVDVAERGLAHDSPDQQHEALQFLLAAAECQVRALPQGWRAMPQVLHGDASWLHAHERFLTIRDALDLAQFLDGIRAQRTRWSSSWRDEAPAILIQAAILACSHDLLIDLLRMSRVPPAGSLATAAGSAVDALLDAGRGAMVSDVVANAALAFPGDPQWLLRKLRAQRARDGTAQDLQAEADRSPLAASDCAVRMFLAKSWYEQGVADRVAALCDGEFDHFAMDEAAAARMAHAQLALDREIDAPGWVAAGEARRSTLLSEADCEPFAMDALRSSLDTWLGAPHPLKVAPDQELAALQAFQRALDRASDATLGDYARCARMLGRVAGQLAPLKAWAGDLQQLVLRHLELLAAHALRAMPAGGLTGWMEDYLALVAAAAHAQPSAMSEAPVAPVWQPILLNGDKLDHLAQMAGFERAGTLRWESRHGLVQALGPFQQLEPSNATVVVRGRVPPFFACLDRLDAAPFAIDEAAFTAALSAISGSANLHRAPIPEHSKDSRREQRWQVLVSAANALGHQREVPRVSILMPIWNGDRFMVDAIGSVLAQTLTSWEVLFVDDGSEDASAHRMRMLGRERPDRFTCLEHAGGANRGLPASRNLALAHARGEYVAMLDIDDMWLDSKLEKQVRMLDAHPRCAMAYGPIMYWYGWTGRPADMRRDFVSPHGTGHDKEIAAPRQLCHLVAHRDGLPVPSGALIRRSALEDGGKIRFDETFGMYEDEVFLSQIALRHPVYVHSEILEWYRQHRDSFTALALRLGEYSPHRPNVARARFLRWLLDHVASSGLDLSGELKALIEAQLTPAG